MAPTWLFCRARVDWPGVRQSSAAAAFEGALVQVLIPGRISTLLRPKRVHPEEKSAAQHICQQSNADLKSGRTNETQHCQFWKPHPERVETGSAS